MLNIDIKGLDQLGDALMKLPTEIAQKELTNALLAGGQVVADEMSAQAPRAQDIGPRKKGYQHVADSIVVQAEKNSIGSAAEVYVGPNKDIDYKARWLEFGTRGHLLVARHKKVLADQAAGKIFGGTVQFNGRKAVLHPGIQPKPFMRSSLAVSANAAIDAFKKALAAGIQRVAKRVKKN